SPRAGRRAARAVVRDLRLLHTVGEPAQGGGRESTPPGAEHDLIRSRRTAQVTLRTARCRLTPSTPSLQRRGRGRAAPRLVLPSWTTEDGAFMEQSGRNRWQPVANGTAAKRAQTSRNRCRG